MPYYRKIGEVPPKRHTTFAKRGGGLHVEELMGKEGFSADASLLYHRHSPSEVVSVDTWDVTRHSQPNHPLLPRYLRTHELPARGDAVTGRHLLAMNTDVAVTYVVAAEPSPLYRNAIGDELCYVEAGTARVETVFGAIDVGPGDLVIIPTSCTHRWIPSDGVVLRLLILESVGHIAPPKRYLSAGSQFLEHAPYCERDLRAPDAPLIIDGDDVDVLVRHHSGGTRYTYAHHPFDVVGWDGCLYPYAFNVADFEPIIGRIHQPPPTFQVFEGPNVVVCAFVPHKTEYHPRAVPVPYNHANVDSDELMFYTKGISRGDARMLAGDITWHPAGFVHGPHPGEVERAVAALESGKWQMKQLHAIMIDTFRPLEAGDSMSECEDPDYVRSWRGA